MCDLSACIYLFISVCIEIFCIHIIHFEVIRTIIKVFTFPIFPVCLHCVVYNRNNNDLTIYLCRDTGRETTCHSTGQCNHTIISLHTRALYNLKI